MSRALHQNLPQDPLIWLSVRFQLLIGQLHKFIIEIINHLLTNTYKREDKTEKPLLITGYL